MSSFNNNQKELEKEVFTPLTRQTTIRQVVEDGCEDEEDEEDIHNRAFDGVEDTAVCGAVATPFSFDFQLANIGGLALEEDVVYTGNHSNAYVPVGMSSKRDITSFPDILPRISIAGLTPFGKDEDLFAALDKSSVDLFVARNQNQRGWSDIPLAITNFESPLNAADTVHLLTDYLATKKVLCETIVPGMFYKCYHSEGFSNVSIHVKLYFNEGKNPVIEFRRVQGSPEIFFNIYGHFRNLILKQNNPISMSPPPTDFLKDKVIISKEEEAAALASLMQWLNSSPADAIKVVSQVAMEKDKDTQIKMCNEVYNVLLREKDLSPLMAQTLGFIDVLQGASCQLDAPHKSIILGQLRSMLQVSVAAGDHVPESVRLRAQRFIAEGGERVNA